MFITPCGQVGRRGCPISCPKLSFVKQYSLGGWWALLKNGVLLLGKLVVVDEDERRTPFEFPEARAPPQAVDQRLQPLFPHQGFG